MFACTIYAYISLLDIHTLLLFTVCILYVSLSFICAHDLCFFGQKNLLAVGEPLAAETHLLVCVHASRDTKCGDIGPELADALETSLPDDGKVLISVSVVN